MTTNYIWRRVSRRQTYSLLETEEVVLSAETDGRDGLLDYGAVTAGQDTAGHALREVFLHQAGAGLGRKWSDEREREGGEVTLSSLLLSRSQE